MMSKGLQLGGGGSHQVKRSTKSVAFAPCMIIYIHIYIYISYVLQSRWNNSFEYKRCRAKVQKLAKAVDEMSRAAPKSRKEETKRIPK